MDTMFIDTHCHLNFKAFKKDVGRVIEKAKRAGVEKMLVVGADLKTSQKAIELANKYDCLYASVGIHPHHVSSLDYNAVQHHHELMKELTVLASNKKVIAIGETGLDYYTYKKTKYENIKISAKGRSSSGRKNLQKQIFLLHLDLAQKLNLPLTIHCRQAFNDLLNILTPKAQALKRKGVFHCFEGNKNHLNQALNLGFYIGFNGIITYPKRENLRILVKRTPIEKLLLETDSPFLTPEPLRGTRNEPKNIRIIAKTIASIKNVSFDEVEEKTARNSYSLFKFS